MITEGVLLGAVALSLGALAAVVIALPAVQRNAGIASRLRAVRNGGMPDDRPVDALTAWMRPFGIVGRAVINSGVLSRKVLNDLEQTVAATGHRSGPALSFFIGAKIALLIGCPMLMLMAVKLAGITSLKPLYVMVGGAMIGLLSPDFIIRGIRKRYLKAVESGMPAALDLLIICAEAGLALEAGFERVALEFEAAIPQTANELRITASEMKLLSDRRQALLNMGRRTGLESMQRLGGVLAQSQKYGTPLTQALRSLAAEMRATTLTRFEARAGRLPVLLTIPMILFILPCIFVVVGGPAFVQVMRVMGTK